MLEALGNIGDFIGGIAVIATLLYLSVQVRQNTKLQRATALAAASTKMVAFNNLLGGNPTAARVFQIGLENFEDLSETERRQFLNLLRGLFSAYQHVFLQHEQGLIDDMVWSQQQRAALASLALPHIRVWWDHRKKVFASSFVTVIDEAAPVAANTLAGDVIADMLARSTDPDLDDRIQPKPDPSGH